VTEERERMEAFYARKWAGQPTLWEDRYPPEARVYANALYRERNRAILYAVPERPGWVLDLGCGAGDLAIAIAERTPDVVGADIAASNLAVAKENARRAERHVAFVHAPAERLPFADGTFDVVVMADVIEHVPDVAAALAEVRRVLRVGGRLVCATPIRATIRALGAFDRTVRRLAGARVSPASEREVYERFLSISELRRCLRDAGFETEPPQRICFYPAPETGGALGGVMTRLAGRMRPDRFQAFADRVTAAFRGVAALRLLNQKQLWVARVPATGVNPGPVGSAPAAAGTDDPGKDYRVRYQVPDQFVWRTADWPRIDFDGYMTIAVDMLPPPRTLVLDVGCGPGFGVRRLIERGYEVHGVDFNERAIGFGRVLVPQGRFALGDLRWLDEVKGLRKTYDAAVCIEVLEHVPPVDRPSVIRGVAGRLRRGGVIVLTTPSDRMRMNVWDYDRATLPELRALLEGAGLRVDAVRFQHRLPSPLWPPLWRTVCNPLWDLGFARRALRAVFLRWFNEAPDEDRAGRYVVRAIKP
jgi:2-polyprenyl-3-methyl-5-hydroxy-6-metoxy-1,4-benzoquinol methylase